MKATHTKGEWTSHKFGDIYVIKEKGLLEKGYSDRIAELHEYPNEQEANAKLIAASPLLYNAAYNALQAIYAMPKGKQGFYQYLKNDLLNAIQKADGTII